MRNFVRENIKGLVLEIGSLDNPFATNGENTVHYMDRYSRDELKKIHANNLAVNVNKIPEVNIIGNGDLLSIEDNTYDAVITCHVLEHLTNPLRAIHEWHRITKPGGNVFMVVPDKRFTFDKDRDVTPVQHLIDDYNSNVSETELAHYQDLCKHVASHDISQAQGMFEVQSNIHVHTFTEDSLKELLKGFEVIYFKRDGMHLTVNMVKNKVDCSKCVHNNNCQVEYTKTEKGCVCFEKGGL